MLSLSRLNQKLKKTERQGKSKADKERDKIQRIADSQERQRRMAQLKKDEYKRKTEVAQAKAALAKAEAAKKLAEREVWEARRAKIRTLTRRPWSYGKPAKSKKKAGSSKLSKAGKRLFSKKRGFGYG